MDQVHKIALLSNEKRFLFNGKEKLEVQKIIIAIDGYSSCGKSTLARDLANRLDYLYIDSGAMYRAVTLFFLKNEVVLSDEKAVANALRQIQIEFQVVANKMSTFLNSQNVEEEIRLMTVRISSLEQNLHHLEDRLQHEKNEIKLMQDRSRMEFENIAIR